MRKFFLGLTVLLFMFLLVACSNILTEVIDEMELIFIDDNKDSVTQNFKVTTTSSYEGAIIEWESENPEVIKIDGDTAIVTRQQEDTQVVLTVVVTIGSNSEFKDFTVIVKALEVNEYTVTFNSNTETTIEEVLIKEGELVTSPTELVKEGHTFTGWYLNDVLYDFNTPVTSDITLEAKWDINTYKITIPTEVSVNIDDLNNVSYNTVVTLKVNVPNGMIIDELLINGTIVEVNNSNEYVLTIKEDVVVSVELREFVGVDVTINPNNGDDTYTLVAEKGELLEKPNEPQRDGFKFMGWLLGEEVYNFNTPVTDEIELVASWQQLFEQEVDKFDFGTSSKTGYDSTSFTFSNTNGNTHTLNKQRAQINSSTNDPHSAQGQMLIMGPVSDKGNGISFVEFDFSGIANISKIEFQFTAWSQAALTRIKGLNNAEFNLQVQNGNDWDTLTDSNDNKNLLTYFESGEFNYKWVTYNNLSAGKYRLYYNAPGANTTNTGQAIVVDDLSVFGLFEVADGNVITFDYNYDGGPSNFINIVEDNMLVDEPTEPVRLGYDFLGWFIGNNEFDFNTPITSSLTLTAQWQQSKLVIIFDFAQASIEPHIELIELNQKVTEISEPQRDGYTFIGWYQTEIGESYNNEYNFNTNLDSNIRLYAKWEITADTTLTRDDDLLTDYYQSVVGLSDQALVNELKTILTSTHKTPKNYGQARYILDKSDKALYNDDLVYGMYYRETINAAWDGVSWNREHVWPNSKLGVARVDNSDINQASDLHNLRAINQRVNSSRGNRYFTNTTKNEPIGHTIGSNGYYPGDEDIGDVARILLYMVLRYDMLKLTNDETLLLLGDTTSNNFVAETAYMGMLNVLFDWHLTDPVDEFELARNEVIYQNQGNRNPFIDHPELFEEVFEYYVMIDNQRVSQSSLITKIEVNVYKISINYSEFKNRREYVI